nr:mitochondrial inner membrane protease ATP23-like [Ipomoea batatas]
MNISNGSEHKRPAGTTAWSGVRGGHTVAEGEVMIQKGLQDPKVMFLREQLEKAGCKITDNFFKSFRCDTPMSGFFCPKSNDSKKLTAERRETME